MADMLTLKERLLVLWVCKQKKLQPGNKGKYDALDETAVKHVKCRHPPPAEMAAENVTHVRISGMQTPVLAHRFGDLCCMYHFVFLPTPSFLDRRTFL